MSINLIKVRNITIGEGPVKICIPLTAGKKEELFSEARKVMEMGPDLIEWRADYFENARDVPVVLDTLRELREIIGGTPLIFCCRIEEEGGKLPIPDEIRFELRTEAIKAKLADILDVELATEERYFMPLITYAKENGVFICASKHYFEYTPSEKIMTEDLMSMQERGADIAKLAVFPLCPDDLLKLLYVTNNFKQQAKIPAITISMSELGLLSRVSGGLFGSSVTFGAGLNSSAPGQIDARTLRDICKYFTLK